jgi:hypothetical protein
MQSSNLPASVILGPRQRREAGRRIEVRDAQPESMEPLRPTKAAVWVSPMIP